MSPKTQLPFGQWPSEITPQNSGGLLDLSEPTWNANGDLFWRERSSRSASIQISKFGSGEQIRVSADYQVGGSLLYGGGSYGVSQDQLCLIDRSSRQLILISLENGTAVPLTANLVSSASPVISPDQRSVLFIHSDGEDDSLFLSPLEKGQAPSLISQQGDFYNYPRWHPSGRQIAWISWNHPYLPWDSSQLWLGELEYAKEKELKLSSSSRIAGGDGISVLQPEFSPDGKWLAFLSDQSGWWQIHLLNLETGESRQLTTAPAEHALPPWLQNRNAYAFSGDSQRIYFLRNQSAVRSIWRWDLGSNQEQQINLDENYTWLDWFSICPKDDHMAVIASAGDLPERLIRIDPTGKTEIIRRSTREDLPPRLFSLPQPVSWKNMDNSRVEGLFYPPHNPKYQGEGQPPLLVMVHSGPTRQKFAEFSPRTQFFTSRGFAVLEVNYRGSTGYGRAYRQALENQWGVSDVDDCLSGALYITDQGWAERSAMALLGSSSGGLTVYQILVKYPGVFRAGIVLYGIVNHLDLLKDPPKFERHYSEFLIGPYPEQEQRYRERSPIFFADRIKDPIAVFQGGNDPIVPRGQADQIIKVLAKNGVPHLYQLYPEEGHGFKIKENLADFYQQSLEFLQVQLTGEKGEVHAEIDN